MRLKTIHKLVLKSYLGPLIMTFFIITFVLMMNFVWRYIDELVGKGLDAGVIIELISYATINMIPMGLPLAMLLAAIMTMGNLGENYELLAMKSAGMSLMRIMKPLIIVAVFISIGSFFVVNNLVPYAYKQMSMIIYDIRRQKQVLEFQDGLFFDGIDNMSIRVEHQSHPDDCEFVAAAAKRYTSHFARVRAASVTKPAGCYKTPDRFVRFANRPAPGQREFPAGATKACSEFCAFLRHYRHR